MIQDHIKVVAGAWLNDEAAIHIRGIVIEPFGQ